MVLLRLFIITALLTLLGENGHAEVYHVSSFGSHTPPFDTYAKAATVLKAAVDATAGTGDSVMIHAGSYNIDTTIIVPSGVHVVGISRDSVFVIHTAAPRFIFTIRAQGDNVFAGITFVNPLGDGEPSTTAIFQTVSSGRMTVSSCRFDQCRIALIATGHREIYDNEFIVHSGDGVICAEGGYTWIHHNTFVSGPEIGGNGHGITASGGDVLIEHNYFDYRPAKGHGFPVRIDRFPTRAIVRNNLILGGQEAIGWSYTDGIIENNTCIGAKDPWGGIHVFQNEFDSLTIRNNLFMDFAKLPTFGNFCRSCPPSGPITLIHNVYWPPVDYFYTTDIYSEAALVTIIDSANFNAYPMFAYDSLFRLQAGSPLIDAGDPTVLDADGSRSDVGWLGGPGGISYGYVDLAPQPPDSVHADGERQEVALRWTPRPEADFHGYRVYRGAVPGFWSSESPLWREVQAPHVELADTLPEDVDSVFYVVTALDATGHESGPSPEARYVIADHPANRAPVFSTIPPQSIVEAGTMSLSVAASDPDGDPLALSAEGLPYNSQFSDLGGGQGTFAFTPDTTQAGDYTVTLIASDGGLADTADIAIHVADLNYPILPPIPRICRVFPNPVNDACTIEIAIPDDGDIPAPVTVDVYDLLGRRVARVIDATLPAGVHTVSWALSSAENERDLATGVYFVHLRVWSKSFGDPYKLAVIR